MCWAHLKREFVKILEPTGVSKQIGEALLKQEEELLFFRENLKKYCKIQLIRQKSDFYFVLQSDSAERSAVSAPRTLRERRSRAAGSGNRQTFRSTDIILVPFLFSNVIFHEFFYELWDEFYEFHRLREKLISKVIHCD